MHLPLSYCFFAAPVLLIVTRVNYINYQDQSVKSVSYSDNPSSPTLRVFFAMIECTASIYVSKTLSRARLFLASVTFWRLHIEPEMLVRFVSLEPAFYEHSTLCSQSIFLFVFFNYVEQ